MSNPYHYSYSGGSAGQKALDLLGKPAVAAALAAAADMWRGGWNKQSQIRNSELNRSITTFLNVWVTSGLVNVAHQYSNALMKLDPKAMEWQEFIVHPAFVGLISSFIYGRANPTDENGGFIKMAFIFAGSEALAEYAWQRFYPLYELPY